MQENVRGVSIDNEVFVSDVWHKQDRENACTES